MLTHEKKKNIKEMREKNSANLIENVMITVIMIAFSHPFRRFFFPLSFTCSVFLIFHEG